MKQLVEDSFLFLQRIIFKMNSTLVLKEDLESEKPFLKLDAMLLQIKTTLVETMFNLNLALISTIILVINGRINQNK